jgi:hypothetical protein
VGGVAQSHELARALANPRCGSELVGVADVMVDNATKLSHHEFRLTVRRWEMLADMDGAHRTAEAAHEGRRAGSWRLVRRSCCTPAVVWRRAR